MEYMRTFPIYGKDNRDIYKKAAWSVTDRGDGGIYICCLYQGTIFHALIDKSLVWNSNRKLRQTIRNIVAAIH